MVSVGLSNRMISPLSGGCSTPNLLPVINDSFNFLALEFQHLYLLSGNSLTIAGHEFYFKLNSGLTFSENLIRDIDLRVFLFSSIAAQKTK